MPIYTISEIIISTIEREREKGVAVVLHLLRRIYPVHFFDMQSTNKKIDVPHLEYAHLGD